MTALELREWWGIDDLGPDCDCNSPDCDECADWIEDDSGEFCAFGERPPIGAKDVTR